ncbi:hypothetical protein C0992_013315 [Termitomyces sp. T32_za158]|nr:hypothetical protein C0992_013315 [Termitomyces sp. T32_za158]
MAPAAACSDKEILQARFLIAEVKEARKGKKGSKRSAAKAEEKENQDMSKIKVEGKAKRHPAAVAKRKNGKLHSQDIARKLFFDPVKPDLRFASFMEDDLSHLGTVVKNWISQLKEKYAVYRKEMMDMGHGLLEEDKQDEADKSSELALLISKNLNLLKRKSPEVLSDVENGSDSVQSLSNDSSDDSLVEVKAPITPYQSSKPVSDISAANRETTIKIARIRYKQKSHESAEKEKIECQSAFNIERLCLEHQHKESEAQRAHELMMLERQLDLERLRRHAPVGPSNPHSWNFGIDPNLN